jgi:hypothetical protein
MDDDDEDFEGYDPIEIHPILEDEDEEEEELPPRVKYSTFQEEEDFDPE